MTKFRVWLKAFRLRTLPLALANAVLGSLLALADGGFRWPVFILALITITFLQILSNLANDYGDAVSGKDNHNRVGPQRVTVSGLVTKSEMKTMMAVFVGLSIVSGTWLILLGLNHLSIKQLVLFFVLGLAAIVAAIKYTVGRNPYGYKGLGDIFVFVFFGLVGVLGTVYLHTHWFDIMFVYPAATIGLFSTGVLNVNNLRDIETDRETGKNTLAVQYGLKFARNYHMVLISAGWLIAIAFTIFYFYSWWQWVYLLCLPLFIRHLIKTINNKNPDELNSELKNLALSTFVFAVLFGLGMVI